MPAVLRILPGGQEQQLQEQLLTVQQEMEALEAVLVAQQEEQQQQADEEPEDWVSHEVAWPGCLQVATCTDDQWCFASGRC